MQEVKHSEGTTVAMPDLPKFEWQRQLTMALTAPDEASKRRAKLKLRTLKKNRDTAYMAIRAMDKQLSLVGCPLRVFVAGEGDKPSTRVLEKTEVRYFIPRPGGPPLPDGAIPERAVVMDRSTRVKRYEIPVWADDRRPNLGICGDQGGSGLPAWVFMLSSLKVRSLLCFDRFHKLSLQDSKWWPIVLETQVVLNLAHGPWLSESWFVQTCEGFESYANPGMVRTPSVDSSVL